MSQTAKLADIQWLAFDMLERLENGESTGAQMISWRDFENLWRQCLRQSNTAIVAGSTDSGWRVLANVSIDDSVCIYAAQFPKDYPA